MSLPPDRTPAGDPALPPENAGGLRDDTYVARVARGAGISTVGQGVGRVVGYLVYAAVARLYGPAQLGLYALGVAAVNGAHILARFGMDNAVVRYVAHYQARDDARRVRGTIIQALGITFAFSLVLSCLMYFGAGFMADNFYNKPGMETVYKAFAFALPFLTFMSMTLWATQGFQTVTYATYTQQMIRPTLNVVLIVAFYVVADGILGAVVAYAVSMILGSAVAVYYLRKLFPRLLDRKLQAKFETRELFDMSIPMSVTTLAQYANTWSALWIMGVFAAAGPTGIFQIAARTATFLTVVRFAFNGIFSPIISSLHAREMTEDLGRLYKDVSRWTFTGAFALFLVIVLLAREILLVAGGENFVTGWSALIIVAGAQLFSTSVGPAPRMLAMTGNQRIVMAATVTAAVTGVAVSYVLVPTYGILGAAVGMSAAIVTENTATLLAVRYRLGFWPYSLGYAKPLAAGLLSAGAAYLVGTALPIPGAIPTIFVLGAVFSVGFLALLVLFGFSATDREFLKAFWDVARRYLRRGNRGPRATGRGESGG